MKKYILLIILSIVGKTYLNAQERVVVHNRNNVIHESLITETDSIKFQNNFSIFHLFNGNPVHIPISEIDSITFTSNSVNPNDNIVYVIYNETDITIINPLENDGVAAEITDGNVSITATTGIQDIEYVLSGSTSNGSFTISSNEDIALTLSNISLTNQAGYAINISDAIATNVTLNGTNNISDSPSGSQSAAFLSAGSLIFDGTGTLNLSGHKKHGISSSTTIEVLGGSFVIHETASDGFHCEEFVMENGSLDIHAEGDAIDAGAGMLTINNGTIVILSTADDVKGIKSDDNLSINGGQISMTIAGAQSKGISGKKDVFFNGGTISIITSGSAVLESLGSGFDPSYCTAVKTKKNIIVNGGTIYFESTNTCDGGKGFSADGSIVINDGNITVSTAGNGQTYTNENGEPDSYTSCCIKSDENITIAKGVVNCVSTGTGGKGIAADGTLTIGTLAANNTELILNISTSGERFYVSGYGNDADYANPKAVKSEGNLSVNSGTITIACTQTDEGGEGLESKDILTINGGIIEIEAYDDCINASNHIEITGGTMYFVSKGNDAVDSNGTLSISGGFVIASGTRAPEGGFDCDQSTFAVTGGIIIGTGGSTSNPTASASTQYSIKYGSATPGNAICIKNSDSETILLFELPTYSGTGGGGPGGPGGGNQMTLLFSDPSFAPGSYTLLYGGTISGGTTVNGYNTGGTYSGGSTKNFTISNKLTTIN